MDNYIAPEIPGYAKTIIKTTFGTKAELQAVKWTGGGLYNKVFYVDTSEGCFVLKIECNKIFPSTRAGQMENEVEGIRLFTQAGIPCPKVLAHDFTGNDIGVRYIFTERVSGDIVWGEWGEMDDAARAEVNRQASEIVNRMLTITNTHFGSLTPSGPLGWHKTWDECYRCWFELLINDGVSIGLFSDEELSILRAAAEKPLGNNKGYTPTFEHGDMGIHNMIRCRMKCPGESEANDFREAKTQNGCRMKCPGESEANDFREAKTQNGHINNEPRALHVIDFGNARYVPPHLTVWGYNPPDVTDAQNLDKGLNLLHLYDFEMGVMWKEMQKLTEDYAHCMDWMTYGIEKSKKDMSRNHITEFVDKCRVIVG